MASNTIELKNKEAIIGIGSSTTMKKTLTILHSGFFQSNSLAGIQKSASSMCSEYRSSLQNEARGMYWNPSEINKQSIVLNQ